MEYNKQQFTKTKDKKVLHKVKKQWVVVSLAMLAMLGSGAMVKKVSAHADVNSDNNTNNGTVTLKDRLNQSLSQAHKATLQTPASLNNRQNNQTNSNTDNNQRNINVNQISQQANVLHKRIIHNANFANANQSTAAVHSENGRNGQQQIRVANQKGTSQKENVSMPRLSSPDDSGDTLPYLNPTSINEFNTDFDEVDTSGQSSVSPSSNPLSELNQLIGKAQKSYLLRNGSDTEKVHVQVGPYQSYSYRYRCIPELSPNGLGNIIIFEGGTLPTIGANGTDIHDNGHSGTNYNNLFPNVGNNAPWHIYFDPNNPTFPAASDISPNSDVLWLTSSDKYTNKNLNDSGRLEKYLPHEYSDLQREGNHQLSNQDGYFDPLDNSGYSRHEPRTAIHNSDNESDYTDYTAPFAAYNDAHLRSKAGSQKVTKPMGQEVKSANLSGLHMSYMYALFQDDPYLESINLKGSNGPEVLNMNAMVNDCPNLNYINLEGLNLSHVRDMRDVFASDKSLKTLNLANVVTSPYVFSYNNTFKNDTNLSSVNLSGIKTVIFNNSNYSNHGNNSFNFKKFFNSDLEAKMFGLPLPDPHSYGIKRMVSDMSDLFYNDPRLQRLRLSSDTIFAASTANQNPADNWGLFGTSNMVADYQGHQINNNNQTLYNEFKKGIEGPLGPDSVSREAIYDLIFPSIDENANIPGTHDYEYFAATDLPLDYKINHSDDKSDASNLIKTKYIINGAIDGEGHQYANGVNYSGHRSDGFETYQGALDSKHNGIITSPRKKDKNGNPIVRPNGYNDSPTQSIEGGLSHYEVNDYGVIDKLQGNNDNYKIYFYSDGNRVPNLNYSDKTQVGKQFNINNELPAIKNYLSSKNYEIDGSLPQSPILITSNLSGEYPIYINGDATDPSNASDFINNPDNYNLKEYSDSGDGTAKYFKVPVKKTIPTGYLNVPIEYYDYYDNSDVKYYSDIYPSSDLSGKYGTYAGGLLQHVNSFMPKYYHIINSDGVSSDSVKNVLNHYTVGTGLSGFGVSGGAYNGGTDLKHSINTIMIPVSYKAKMSIKYINKLNPTQSKVTSSHGYNAPTFAPNMKEHVKDLAQDDLSSISHFYIDSGDNSNYSNDPSNKDIFDVYVLPHVYNIPVDLYYGSNKLTHSSINVLVTPSDYDQPVGTSITDKIKAYLNNSANNPDNKYVLTTSIQNILNKYKAGDAKNFNQDGIQGGALSGYNLAGNPANAGSVSDIHVPLKLNAFNVSVNYYDEKNPSNTWPGRSPISTASNQVTYDQVASNNVYSVPDYYYIDDPSKNNYPVQSHTVPNTNPQVVTHTVDVGVMPYSETIPITLYKENTDPTNRADQINSGYLSKASDDYYGNVDDLDADYVTSNLDGYSLRSDVSDAIASYTVGTPYSEDGITGGGLIAGDQNSATHAGDVSRIYIPVYKPVVQQLSVIYNNEFYNHPSAWSFSDLSWFKTKSNNPQISPDGDIPEEVKTDGVPKGYHIDPNNNNYSVENNSVTVNVMPNYVDVPIEYHDVSDVSHPSSIIGNSKIRFQTGNTSVSNHESVPDTKSVTNSYLEGLPTFPHTYETYPQDQYNFFINNDADGNHETVIPVAKQHVVAEGNWDLSDTNSAKFEVTSDDNGNHPHSDTLTFYGGPLDTNSWNKAGYYTDPQNKKGAVYVFGSTENGSDTMPNALNRDSIKYVVFANSTQLPSGYIKSSNGAVTGSDTGLFKDMHNLTSVQFNGNVDASQANNLASMFSDDTSLQSLNLGNMDVSKVKDMSNMFAGDSDLSNLTLSTTPTSSLQDMSGMFASDINLKGTTFRDKDVDSDTSKGTNSIKNLSDIKTDKVSDMSDVFESDTGLTNLDLSSWNTDNVSDMDAMFANDKNLQHLNIQNMTTNNVYPGSSDQMFQGDFCASDNSYSDNPSDPNDPNQKDYAIVMNRGMHLGVSSSLIGYWASPDYANDPVMFSPRELDQYGANLGPNNSATWIKWANEPTDLEAEDFQYYNQAGDKVGSDKIYLHNGQLYGPNISSSNNTYKTDNPQDLHEAKQDLYNAIHNSVPAGYQLTPENDNNVSTLKGNIPKEPVEISNSPFSFQKGSHRINVLGDSDSQDLPIRVREFPNSNYPGSGYETRYIPVAGYYGDHSDTISDDQWYRNGTSGAQGPDNGYKLDMNSNNTYYDDNGQLVFNLQNQGNPYTLNKNAHWKSQLENHNDIDNKYLPHLYYQSQQAYLDIVYRDLDGSDVGSDQISNQSDYIGNTVPVPNMTDPNKDSHGHYKSDGGHNAYHYNLPQGYNVNPGQYKYGYRIQSEHPIVNIYVYGESALRVVYVNQSGDRVGRPNTIAGVDGQTVNVTDPSDGGEPIPQGYTLDGGDHQIATGHQSNSDVIGNDQDTVYKLSPGERTIYLHLDGNAIDPAKQNQAHVEVICLLHDQNGCTKVRVDSDYQLKPKEDNEYSLNNDQIRIGDDFTITPNNPYSDAKLMQGIQGYSITPSDSSQLVHLNTDGVSPNKVVFNYNQSTPGQGSITIHYFDSDTHQEVASGVKNGSIGSSTKPSDVVSVPQGYHLDNGDDNSYTYSNVPQDVWLPVSGNSVQDAFTVYQILKDGHGHETVRSDHYNVSGKIGDSFHISPYGFDSDGADYSAPHTTSNSDYSADDSDQDTNVRFDSDGRLSMSSVAYAYTKRVQAPTIGTFNIVYIDDVNSSNNERTFTDANHVSTKCVDYVSDSGLQGDPFDLDPFYDDMPSTLARSYTNDGDKVYEDTDNGAKLSSDYYSVQAQTKQGRNPENTLHFNGTHTIYIHIKPIE